MPKKKQIEEKIDQRKESGDSSENNLLNENGPHPKKLQMYATRGSLFQLKLLMLFLLKGFLSNHIFELGTEITEAYKFDDLVFALKKMIDGKIQNSYYIVQAKHTKDKTINIDDIMTNADVKFGLAKYYFSFKAARKEKLFKNGTIKYAIVYTNADFELDKKIPEIPELCKDLITIRNMTEEIDVESEADLSFCKIDQDGKFYRFKEEIVLEPLKKIIAEYPFKVIADRLLDFLFEKKQLSKEDHVFQKYDILLAKQVIDKKTKFFREDFICSDHTECEYLQKLKNALNDADALKKRYKDLKTLYEDKELNFNISNSFGESKKIKKNQIKDQTWFRGDSKLVEDSLKDLSFEAIRDNILKQLVSKLVDCLLFSKSMDKNDGIFKEFHVILSRDVIDIENKRFYDKFTNHVETNEKTEKKLIGLFKFRKMFEERIKFNLADINKYIENGDISLRICKGFESSNTTEQLWPDENEDQEIKDFLKVHIFAVNQPNENTLGKKIKISLSEQYPQYDSTLMFDYFFREMFDWMVGEHFLFTDNKVPNQNRFISSKKAEEFFKTVEEKFNKELLMGPTVDYRKFIDICEFCFEDPDLEKKIDDFLNSDKKTFQITTDHIKISSMKLTDILTKIHKELKFIYTQMSSLFDSFSDLILRTFDSESLRHLLVIEYDSDEKNVEDKEIKLFNILNKYKNKKLILIKQRNDILTTFESEFSEIKFTMHHDDKNSFSNLGCDLKKYILQKTIKLQNIDVKLESIVDCESQNLINGFILLKIIENEPISIGEQLPHQENIENIYINRKFISETTGDNYVHLISEIDEIEFYKDSNDHDFEISHHFDNLYMTDSESIVYQRSFKNRGSKNIFFLRKRKDQYLLINKPNSVRFDSEEFKKSYNTSTSNIILISAEAGMGKSTLFMRLAEKLKKQNPEFLVIHIELNYMSGYLLKLSENNEQISVNDVINFFSNAAKLESNSDENLSTFSRNLLELYLRTEKVIVFFDGLDEICPRYKDVFVNLLKVMKSETKIKNIFISTRPYDFMLNDLNTEFNMKLYNMEPFDKKNQKCLIKKYWIHICKLEFNEDFYNIFFDEISAIFHDNIKDFKKEYFDTALHLTMIAITLKRTFEHFSNLGLKKIDRNQRTILTEMLKLPNLYENFMKIKFNIYYENKGTLKLEQETGKEIADFASEEIFKITRLLSLNALFEDDQILIFMTEDEKNNLEKYKKRMIETGDRRGIVNDIRNGKPFFVHKTFAEYFAADYISSSICCGASMKFLLFFVENILNEKHDTICNFIDVKLSRVIVYNNNNKGFCEFVEVKDGNPLHVMIKNQHFNIAQFLIDNNINLNYIEPITNMTAYHMLSYMKNNEFSEKIFKTILQKAQNYPDAMEMSLLSKDYNDETPLFIALRYKSFDCIKTLIDAHVNLKILQNAIEYKNRSGCNVIHCCTMNDNSEVVQYVLDLFENESEKLKSLLKNNTSEYCSPLFESVRYGNINNVRKIVEKYSSFEIFDDALTAECVNKRNIIHYAAENKNPDILKYILKIFKEKKIDLKNFLLHKRKCSDGMPLNVAAEHGLNTNIQIIIDTLIVDLNVSSDELFNVDIDGWNIFHSLALEDKSALDYVLKRFENDKHLSDALSKTDNEGNSPLFVAIKFGFLENIKLFIDAYDRLKILKNRINDKNKNKWTLFHLAVYRNYSDISTYLLDRFNEYQDEMKVLFKADDNKGNLLIHNAARFGFKDNIKAIIDKYKELDIFEYVFTENNKYKNILHLASKNDNDGVLKFLLDYLESETVKCFLQDYDKKGNSPLFYTIKGNSIYNAIDILTASEKLEILDNLLEAKNVNKWNAFHFATCNNSTAVLIYLLDKFENNQSLSEFLLQKESINYETPMSFSIKIQSLPNLKILFSTFDRLGIREAALSGKNKKNMNPFHQTAVVNSEEILKFLCEKYENNLEALKILFQQQDDNGDTPLLTAIKFSSSNFIKNLIDRYKKMEIFDDELSRINLEKCNLIHCAIQNEDIKILENILKLFIDDAECLKLLFHQTNKSNQTPINFAAFKGCVDNIQIIIEAYIKLRIFEEEMKLEDENGYNILHSAAFKYNFEVFECFLKLLSRYDDLLKYLLLKKNNSKELPLTLAVFRGDNKKIDLLFDALKKLEILEKAFEDEDNLINIFHVAASRYSCDVLKELLNRFSNYKDLLKKLLKRKCDKGLTPLFHALKHGPDQNVKIIISTYDSLQILETVFKEQDENKRNIFFYAIDKNKNDLFRYLLNIFSIYPAKLKLSFEEKDKDNNTLLFIAAQNGSIDDFKSIIGTSTDAFNI